MSIPGAKLLKMRGTIHGDVELYQLDSGKFCVKSCRSSDKEEDADYSAPVEDLNTATFVFDAIVRAYEGH